MTIHDKILGGLYGQALGDAWGLPVHFDLDQTWTAYGGRIIDLRPGPAESKTVICG
ncbi:MAG: hypothetical protein JW910_00270 [Anaerolineae bacterium]|nr:hypothetical protein [Anaerolineae bacterium]